MSPFYEDDHSLDMRLRVAGWGCTAGAGCRRPGVNGLGQQCDYHHLNGQSIVLWGRLEFQTQSRHLSSDDIMDEMVSGTSSIGKVWKCGRFTKYPIHFRYFGYGMHASTRRRGEGWCYESDVILIMNTSLHQPTPTQSNRPESQLQRKSGSRRTCRRYIIFWMISSVYLTIRFM